MQRWEEIVTDELQVGEVQNKKAILRSHRNIAFRDK